MDETPTTRRIVHIMCKNEKRPSEHRFTGRVPVMVGERAIQYNIMFACEDCDAERVYGADQP